MQTNLNLKRLQKKQRRYRRLFMALGSSVLALEIKCPSTALRMLSLFEFMSSNGTISRLPIECPGIATWSDTKVGFFNSASISSLKLIYLVHC